MTAEQRAMEVVDRLLRHVRENQPELYLSLENAIERDSAADRERLTIELVRYAQQYAPDLLKAIDRALDERERTAS